MFKPDYHHIVDAALNREPKRVPLYEHLINRGFMERITGKRAGASLGKHLRFHCNFFRDHGYDTVSYEACVGSVLPHGGALARPGPGYINSAERFYNYPFGKAVKRYKLLFKPYFKALRRAMPEGMKAVGGVGNGVFEIVQDLTGYENLCLMSYDMPEVYAALFQKTGDMLLEIWKWFLDNFADVFCVLRFGDDLGFRTNTLLPHDDIRKHIIPQYKRIISLIHSYDKPFLLHSCGNILGVMDDLIEAGIDAKHSNEDQIASFSEWVDRYGGSIGNFGGIDTDHLVRMEDDELIKKVTQIYNYCSKGHGGFAIGSGNSIPDYVDPKKYLLMIDTVRRLRGDYESDTQEN